MPIIHPANEAEAIPFFINWANEQPSVRALVLTSTRAIPTAASRGMMDILSDYDLILALSDVRPFFEDRSWLEVFSPVLALYRDPLQVVDGHAQSGYVVQFETGLKIDFSLWQADYLRQIASAETLPEEFDAGYRVLLDKDHLTDGLKPPTYQAFIPKPPTEREYLTRIEEFFLDTGYVAKFLWRDDMLAAKHLLDTFVKQEHLRPLLEWHLEIEHGWRIKPGPYGRRMKRWLRPDLWAALEATYTGMGIAENWEALYRTIALMRKTAQEVGRALGYVYPEALDRRAMAYLERVKNLDPESEGF